MIYYLNEKKINLVKIEYYLKKILLDINILSNKSLKNFLIKISGLN